MKTTSTSRFPRNAGFTLVEIMIALLIGVIGIVVIMQVYAVSEGYKRTATSGTDAQVNGAIALYLLEREIRLSGYGMNSLLPSGCTSIRVWNSNTGMGQDLRLVPFEINPPGVLAGDPNSDVVVIAYGASDNFVTGVPASQLAGVTSNFKVTSNRNAFRNGDLVIGMQPGAGPGGATSCVMHELTAVPGAAGNCGAPPAGGSDVLVHGTTSYNDPNNQCKPKAPVHNSASGIKDANGNTVPALNAATGGQLFNMGALPQVKAYAVRNANLTVCDLILQDCNVAASWAVVVNEIVSLRAVYGEDFDGNPTPGTPAGDGRVDQWSRAALTTPNQISRLLAAGVQVTARNPLKEKPSSGTTCDTTTDAARPDKGQTDVWYQQYVSMAAGPLNGAAIDLSTSSADWQCYRYKLFQTSVPLRNMIWRPS